MQFQSINAASKNVDIGAKVGLISLFNERIAHLLLKKDKKLKFIEPLKAQL